MIGFTMEMGDRICPNTVGCDIGCGMTAFNIGNPDRLVNNLDDEEALEEIDEEIREHVPMGRSTFSDTPVDQDFHLINDFPWEICEAKLEVLNENWDGEEIESPEYGGEYFKDLCEKVEYDSGRAIFSFGTLGGGNHFVEISRSEETGSYWVVVHSGSRGIGYSIADYWQDKATEKTFERNSIVEIPEDEIKYFDCEAGLVDKTPDGTGSLYVKPSELSINREAVLEDYDGEAIEGKFGQLKSYMNAGKQDSSPLDYLEGEERHGYLVDMIFAQTYAAYSRNKMCESVADVLDAKILDQIQSTHNYIDFQDLTIRKGATRVHDGERGVIPFNMADGAIIVRGKGNDEWNRSAPHGAGRRGSRTWAFDEFSVDEFEESMEGVFSTSVNEDTLDEAPMAYKDKNVVLERIEETAEIVDTLTPVMNLKADE